MRKEPQQMIVADASIDAKRRVEMASFMMFMQDMIHIMVQLVHLPRQPLSISALP